MTPLATIRASSWADLLDCSLRWASKHVIGLNIPATGAAHLGTSLHAGAGAYDSSRLPGGSPISATDAAGVFVDTLRHPEEDVDLRDDDLPLKDAERIGVALTARYCADIAPTHRYLAVELHFEALDVETDCGIIRFTGTTDRIRETADGKAGAVDLKSGKRAVEGITSGNPRAVTAKHGLQLGLYTLLAEKNLGFTLDAPAEIIGLQTTEKAHVAVGEIAEPKLALLGTDEQPGLIELAARMFRSGDFMPNPGSMLCSSRYCPYYDKCIYRAR